jgi:hypothetical protein
MESRTNDKPLDKRCREAHPEVLVISGKTLERNDFVAKKYTESERTVNRRDREGAPYIYISNIKYRPQPDYDDFLLANYIKVDKPEPAKRRRAPRSRSAKSAETAAV